MKNRPAFSILILFFVLMAIPGYGGLFNQRNYLMGERGAMMGGAFTALSEDISGAYYNPAGLAFIQESSLVLNVSVYRYDDYVRDDYGKTTAKATLDKKKLNFVPTGFGVNFRLYEGLVMALSLFQLDSFYFSSFSDNGSQYVTLDLEQQDYLFGASIAYQLSNNLSMGLSIFYHFSKAKYKRFERVSGDVNNLENNCQSEGITPILGLKWYITSNWQLGLMYGFETIHITGKNTYSISYTATSYLDKGQTDGDIRLPHRIAIGLAYEEKHNFTFALDIIYYFKLNYSAPHEILRTEYADNEHQEADHFDISIGGEVYLSKVFALRFGLYTNTSSATDQDLAERINQFGLTLGLGYIVGNLSTGIGFNLMYGKSSIQKSRDDSMAEWRRFSMQIILGGTIYFGSRK